MKYSLLITVFLNPNGTIPAIPFITHWNRPLYVIGWHTVIRFPFSRELASSEAFFVLGGCDSADSSAKHRIRYTVMQKQPAQSECRTPIR